MQTTTNLISFTRRIVPGAPLVVLLHGLGSSSSPLVELMLHPLLEGYSYMAPDSLGHGSSAKPSDGVYSLEEHTEAIAECIEREESALFHLICHSFGGAVGIHLYRRMPARILSFINLEGNLIPEDCGIVSRRTAAVSEADFETALYSSIREDLAPFPRQKRDLERCPPYAFHRSAVDLVRVTDSGSLLREYQSLKIPRVYIYGDSNSATPIVTRIDERERVAISHAGHMMMMDNPTGTAAAVSKFLRAQKS